MDRIAIISDIHGNLPALEAVLVDIAAQGIAHIYHLGDLVGYNPFPNETVSLMAESGIKGVLGNYDQAVLGGVPDPIGAYLNPQITPMGQEIYLWTVEQVNDLSRQFLGVLPEQYTITLGSWQVLLSHGSPRNIREYIRPTTAPDTLAEMLQGVEARIVLTGHTHIPMIRRVNEQWLVNPGSVGFPKDSDPRAAYAIMEMGKEFSITIRRVEYDVERTAAAILAAGLPPKAADDLRVGRR